MTGLDWKGFIEEVKRNPKNFAKAVVDNLSPPKYVIEAMKGFEWMCHFCWQPRCDECFLCRRSICEQHIAKTFLGEKTKAEWNVCPDCFKVHDEKEIVEKVAEDDEQLWLAEKELP